jgi:hypothetical protein
MEPEPTLTFAPPNQQPHRHIKVGRLATSPSAFVLDFLAKSLSELLRNGHNLESQFECELFPTCTLGFRPSMSWNL